MAAADKLNRRIHWLLLAMGTTLIVAGIYWGIKGQGDFHLILTTIGGALLGSSAGWMIEEYYRKGDERTDAFSLYQKTFDFMRNHLRVNDLVPPESDLVLFRRSPLYFYYTTFTEDGEPFWNYLVFDFTKVVVLGRLIVQVEILDLDRTPYPYDVELYRLKQNDPILIYWRPSNSTQSAEVALLDPLFAPYQKVSCGLLDHEDWGRVRRLSKAILSTTQLLRNAQPGPVDKDMANKLEAQWAIKYQRGYELFGKREPL